MKAFLPKLFTHTRWVSPVLACLFIFISSSTFAQNCSINAGVDKSICVGQTLLLDGSIGGVKNNNTIQWSIVSQPAGASVSIANTNSLSTTAGTATVPGTYTFQFAVLCGDGTPVQDNVNITVNAIPTLPVITGTTTFTCYNGTPINLSGTAPIAGETVRWFVGGGNSGTFSAPTSSTTTFTPNFPQDECSNSYKIDVSYVVSNSLGCSNTSTVSLTFTRSRPLTATTNPNPVCGTGATLKGSCPGSGTVQWTLVSKPAGASDPTFGTATAQNTNVGGLIAGTYVFRYTVTGGCNPGFVDVTLTVAGTGGVSIANAGNNQYYCTIPSLISLGGNAPGVGENVTWALVSGGTSVVINTPNAANTTVSGLTTAGAPYVFSYTISTPGGCSSTGLMGVYVEPTLLLTANPVQLCTVGATASSTAASNLVTFGNYLYDQLDTVNVSVTYLSGPAANVLSILGGGSTLNSSTSTTNISTNLGQTISRKYWNTGNAIAANELFSNRPAGLISPNSVNYYLLAAFTVSTVGTYKFQVTFTTKCGTYTKEVTIQRGIAASGVNAGTDIALACNSVSTMLAGSLNNGFGIWSTITVPAGATDPFNSGNQTLRNPTLSGLINGTYIFRYSNNGGAACGTVSDDLKIVVANVPPPAPAAGADNTTCAGTVNLSGNAIPPGVLAQWTVVSPVGAPVTFSDATIASPAVYGLLPNTVYVFRYTFTNGCGTAFDDITVTTTASTAPAKPVLTGSTAADCGFSPSASFPVANSITFTIPALTGTQVGTVSVITDPADALTSSTVTSPTATTRTVNFTLNKEATISYIYCVNDPSNCAPITVCDTISRAFYLSTTTVSAGPDQQFCAVPAYPFNVTLTGSTRLMTTKWTMIYSSNGLQATINSPSTEVTTVSIPASGTYRFKYEVVGNDPLCSLSFSSDIVEISCSDAGSIALAGDDISFCNATGVTALNATALASGTGQWQVVNILSGAVPIINTPSSATSNISFSQSGSVELSWSSSGSNSVCGASSSDKVIVTYYAPAQAGNDQSFCSNTSTVLNALNPTPATGVWSQVNGPNTAAIANTSDFQTVVSGLIPGTYTFRWSVTAPSCSTTDDVVITVTGNPQTAAAGPDANTCSGGTGVIQLNATPAPVGYTGTWALVSAPAGASAGTFQNVNLATSQYSGVTVQGSYVFSWTVSNGICSTTDFITITGTATPCSIVLPITLGSFYAQANNTSCAVQLNWVSQTEVNVSTFNVERSTDGVNFTTIKVLPATGNSTQAVNYSWNDNTVSAGLYYYRLRIIDKDGTFKFSAVTNANLNCGKSVAMQILPNALAKGQNIKVRLTMTSTIYKGTLIVTNATGQQVSVYPVVLHQGVTTVDYPYSNLPAGSYILYLKDDKGQITENGKFIVR